MYDWFYSGVDPSIPGTGGVECVQFSGIKQRFFEITFGTALGAYIAFLGITQLLKKSTSLKEIVYYESLHVMTRKEESWMRFLLFSLCLAFGIELGFKFASKSLIFLLNPCHIVTMLQIYVLVASPSRSVIVAFQVQWYMLNGATLALLFPVLNTRFLPLEMEIYYIQHICMLVIPVCLARKGGIFSPEEYGEYGWLLVTLGTMYIYHFVILQGIGLLTQVNLNNMICPAISDPFYGPWYRIWAILHEALMTPLHGKLMAAIVKLSLIIFPVQKSERVASQDRQQLLQNGCIIKEKKSE